MLLQPWWSTIRGILHLGATTLPGVHAASRAICQSQTKIGHVFTHIIFQGCRLLKLPQDRLYQDRRQGHHIITNPTEAPRG
ncbi:hypothetical protein K491DRAFT_184836 [Lophiostoma macrostomum CBS 122681]|uniref:Secreted protein n=1 Tax=Lophiostoma macrostomum CBS 122681 TaxID=1314788 RepID=A0A6A6TUR6_9PLEO|nr:hypothetical protein K491DRAFT_184836 [Lophiostoma macrostomum CBS 122681]